MKRYWLSILLAPLIVAGVGSYYVQAAANRLPEFVLQQQSGDGRAADGVTLRGSYGNREMRETVSIDAQGSEYSRERHLFQKLGIDWSGTQLGSLIESYPQFMRGKREIRSLYEDDARVAYANVERNKEANKRNFRFAVSVLDKKQQRTVSYEAAVPDGERYELILVNDVLAAGEQLKVVTVNYLKNKPAEIHMYTLGLQSGQTPADRTLPYDNTGTPGIETVLKPQTISKPMGPGKYAVVYAALVKKIQDARGGYRSDEVGGRLFVYDVESGREVKVDSKEIGDFLSGSREGLMQIEVAGDSIFFAKSNKQTGQEIKAIQYDIAAAKSAVYSLHPGSKPRSMEIKGGRLYMVTGSDKDGPHSPSLLIADMKTGSTIYEGKIALAEPDRYPEETLDNLDIYSLSVK
ncbi:hypothetical protein SD70_10510 [Gordoniibacillus kamchatkensis]|uniref:Uncharacterized protein n=1 Tax=Gordoniibacillus kamchatkensis TaxID=1590651 RepID=A0ABR5AII3_9BACL|nr:hypothetical protein [Paenibacillus sp. VKM B-2647]KIL40860.1 hypothetical protein SD70_10510 [Paenibacillus sp. VKM B-2647]